jgi:hypothetical protein
MTKLLVNIDVNDLEISAFSIVAVGLLLLARFVENTMLPLWIRVSTWVKPIARFRRSCA